jgi:uncharacterized protein YkwD
MAACQAPVEPAPAAAPTGTTPTLPGNCAVADSPAQALAKLNDYRAAGARCGSAGNFPSTGALQWQGTLAQVAASRGRALAPSGGSGGSGGSAAALGDDHLTARLLDAGYPAQSAAENRAAGPTRLALVVADWVRNPASCARLMSPSYTEAGLACQRAADGSAHWVLVLAKPR